MQVSPSRAHRRLRSTAVTTGMVRPTCPTGRPPLGSTQCTSYATRRTSPTLPTWPTLFPKWETSTRPRWASPCVSPLTSSGVEAVSLLVSCALVKLSPSVVILLQVHTFKIYLNMISATLFLIPTTLLSSLVHYFHAIFVHLPSFILSVHQSNLIHLHMFGW